MNEMMFMRRCMELASLGKGYSRSNPMVGAVLVYQNQVIASGGHHRLGGEHAEVHCFNQVPTSLRDRVPASTLYVNLEPCAHFGKTPPCADRVIQEKVAKVVIANQDPFDQVNGEGIRRMEQAGIEIQLGLGQEMGRWLNRRFFCLHEKKRPYIILKWAESHQGYLAPTHGKRYRLSSPIAQRLNHKWRTEEGAILVGSRTAQYDNPQLTPRLYPGDAPLRVCIAPQGGLDPQLFLIKDGLPTWVFHAGPSRQDGAVAYHEIPPNQDPILLMLAALYQERIPSLIVEGGSQTLESFFRLGIWDELRVITAPNPLAQGIPSPRIRDGRKIMDLPLGPDRLRVYLHKDSSYPYVEGMEL